MNREKAIVQIGDLMQQAGIPANHAADIVRRLRSAFAIGAGGTGPRVLTSSDAKNSNFFNEFKTDEQPAQPNLAERAGKDGLPGAAGWGAQGPGGAGGPPGTSGVPGFNPEEPDIANLLSIIQAMLSAMIGGITINLDRVNCRDFKSKFNNCITADDIPGGGGGGPAVCTQLGGLDPCRILRKHANQLGDCSWAGQNPPSICRLLERLDKRIRVIESQLDPNNTVEC